MLPNVQVRVAADGCVTLEVDDRPYDAGAGLDRTDVRALLDRLTVELGSPIRVEVHEHDGATFTDIVMPSADAGDSEDADGSTNGEESATVVPAFLPGEELVLAYVVARPRADHDGVASLHLPPALLAKNRDALLLIGQASGTVASFG